MKKLVMSISLLSTFLSYSIQTPVDMNTKPLLHAKQTRERKYSRAQRFLRSVGKAFSSFDDLKRQTEKNWVHAHSYTAHILPLAHSTR